jgi:hypothetical protein
MNFLMELGFTSMPVALLFKERADGRTVDIHAKPHEVETVAPAGCQMSSSFFHTLCKGP